MRVRRVGWHPLRVPFGRPFATARGTLAARDAIVVALQSDEGTTGWGEATPWPAFGLGDVASAAAQMVQLGPRLVGCDFTAALAALDEPGWEPAVRCAFELALFDLVDREGGTPVAARFGVGRGPVAVNALLGGGAPAAVAAAGRAAVEAGFGTLKLKIGAGSLAADVACVAALRAAVGAESRLRLDANGAWSEADARAALDELAQYDLEFVEQPVAADDIGALARVRAASPVRVAADEAVRDLASLRDVLAAGAADVVIVKPMVVGGLRAAFAIAGCAADAGVSVLVTTTIDFGCATAGALHLAAALAVPYACGLATAALLADDLTGGEPAIVRGAMALPPAPGLGVVPDRAALARYAVAPLS